MQQVITIGNKKVGPGHPVFIIAELGINHKGDMSVAKEMMREAKRVGADAVKLQSFITEDFVGDKELMYTYKSQGKEVTESQFSMFKRYELTRSMQKELFAYAKKIGIILFSTPQDNSFKTVDFLCSSEINMPAIKVGSDDLSNLALMEHYAKKKKPMIISTGMATIDEVHDAVETVKKAGNEKLIVLKCTSLYPTPPEKANLLQIKTLQSAFDVMVGYSDHTVGATAAVVATILGAVVIEKHFTLSKEMAGPDHWFSADPVEMKQLVDQVREAEKILGIPQLILSKEEAVMKRDCRRSVMAMQEISKGTVITKEMVDVKRPGFGLPPKYLPFIVGRTAKKDIKKDQVLSLSDLK